MSHISVPKNTGSPELSDKLGQRLRWALVVSLLANLLLWRGVSAIARHRTYVEPKPVEFSRVIIDNKGRKTVKVVTKKQIEKKIAKAHKEIIKRKPEWKPPKQLPKPRPTPQPPKPKPAAPPPEGAHNRVMTAKPDKTTPPSDEPTALSGGNAAVGKPIENQNPGNATANPPTPPVTPPTKIEPPKPPVVTPVVQPKPTPKVEPKPEPKPAPPPPPPPEPPKPKGPTREAQPDSTIKPEIPDELKHDTFKSFVRVKVEIEPDGSFSPILRTSSGNAEIDRRVLEALKRWKWKPALRDGEPVKSTQLFKFEFEVD